MPTAAPTPSPTPTQAPTPTPTPLPTPTPPPTPTSFGLEFVAQWLGPVTHELFDFPSGVAVSPSGAVYVLDFGANRVHRFDRDLAFRLSEWGSEGSGSGRFDQPLGIAVGESGRVYVADTGHHPVPVFGPPGEFLDAPGSPGGRNGR